MPRLARTDEMLRTRPPPPWAIICRTAAWVGTTVLRTLRSMIQSQSERGYDSALWSALPAPPPTALTMMSIRPNFWTVSLDDPLAVGFVGRVGDDGEAIAARGPHALDRRVERFLGPAGDDDLGPGLGEGDGQRRPDAAGTARDDGDQAIEPEVVECAHRPPRVLSIIAGGGGGHRHDGAHGSLGLARCNHAPGSRSTREPSPTTPGCIRRAIPAATRVGILVKANGYGHGMVVAAEAAIAGGADQLMVVSMEEALALRAAGVTAPILIVYPIDPEAIDEAVRAGFEVSVVGRGLGAAPARGLVIEPRPRERGGAAAARRGRQRDGPRRRRAG